MTTHSELIGKHRGKRTLGRHRSWWLGNIMVRQRNGRPEN